MRHITRLLLIAIVQWLLVYAIVSLLVGCSVNESLPVFVVDDRSDRSVDPFERISQACELWEIECIEARELHRAWVVVLSDSHGASTSDGGRHCGDTRYDRCLPFTWVACLELHTVEHELGHAFGLGHSSDRNNVMQHDANADGASTTREQREAFHKQLERFGRCIDD